MEYGASITALTAPTLDGYNFVGWFTTAARTTLTTFTNITSNRNAYAKYSAVVKGETWNDLTQDTWNDFPDTDTWEDI